MDVILDFGAPHPTSIRTTQEYRRNGKLQSCEPCRLSKLRCDHSIPCGRCVKRRRIDECVYHPAPLTKKRKVEEREPLPSLPSKASATRVDAGTSVEVCSTAPDQSQGSLSLGAADIDPRSKRSRAASAPLELDDRRASTTRASPGFLGSTSFTAVFSEDLTSLDVSRASEPGRDGVLPSSGFGADQVLRGCKILAMLQDHHIIDRFIERSQELIEASAEVIPCSMMRQWLEELWDYHSEDLRRQDPHEMSILSELVWRNTKKPLVFDGSYSAKAWTSLSTGASLRWEVVGAILAAVGLAAQGISPLDDIFRQFKTTRKHLSQQMHDGAVACLALCRDCEAHDDLFQWFLNDLNNLTGAIIGPDYHICYRQTGELVNAVIATGYQREIKADSQTPFFLAELRKRSRASCYSQEVALGSLLGRPPRLSHRYTSLDLPRDIADNDLFRDNQEMGDILASLDENGWNKNGTWFRLTFIRCSILNAPRREDALDLSLGNYPSNEIQHRAEEIRRKFDDAWAQVPAFFRAARDSPASKTTPILIALYHNSIRHGYLGTQLLLQQVLMRKVGAPSDELIRIARLVFKDMMTITGRNDIQKGFCIDLTWLLASRGLRCAAILVVELYKQEQSPIMHTAPPRIPRAETTRELSIFVQRLAEVEPDDGLYSFCEQGRSLIGYVLDKILAPPPHDAGRSATDTPNNVHFMQVEQQLVDPTIGDLGSMDFGLSGDVDFMQWLDNMDWSRA